MKKVLISLACLAVVIALYACSNAGNDDLKTSGTSAEEIRFERIDQDALSADLSGRIDRSHAEEGYETITIGNDNFIVVYAGERPTAGYSIEIISIVIEEGKTKVTVKEASPAEGGITAQVITYPFDVAKLGAAISGNVEIEFVEGNAE